MATILNYSAGRISTKQAAKNILIYHFIIPSLIQAISDGFRFDEKNQIRSWILGGFNGMYIVGSLANNALFSLINGINFGTVSIPAIDIWGADLQKALLKINEGDISADDILDSLVLGSDDITSDKFVSNVLGVADLTGLPVQRLYGISTSVQSFNEGLYYQAGLRLAGISLSYSDYIERHKDD